MKISRLTEAMTNIDDELISGAMVEKSASKRMERLKYLAVAACFVFAVTAGVIGISHRQKLPTVPDEAYGDFTTVDSEGSVKITEDELKNTEFGELFPSVLPDGYKIHGDIVMSGDRLVSAVIQKGVYYKTSSAIKIEIADKKWFEDDQNTNRKDGGVYFEIGNLGAKYSMYSGVDDLGALNEAMMSAACFAEREVVEIPHSYDGLETTTLLCVEHKYYNVQHSGEPTLYQFQHADMAGYVCTATFEEYWHDMVCSDCGEVFGGYTKVCSEIHSNCGVYAIVDGGKHGKTVGFYGRCNYTAVGLCYISDFEVYADHARAVDEYFTYGYPLRWEDSIIELRDMIAAGIYELDENGVVKPWNGYLVGFEDGRLLFYSLDENAYICPIRWYDENDQPVYEVQREDPKEFDDNKIVWRSDQNS